MWFFISIHSCIAVYSLVLPPFNGHFVISSLTHQLTFIIFGLYIFLLNKDRLLLFGLQYISPALFCLRFINYPWSFLFLFVCFSLVWILILIILSQIHRRTFALCACSLQSLSCQVQDVQRLKDEWFLGWKRIQHKNNCICLCLLLKRATHLCNTSRLVAASLLPTNSLQLIREMYFRDSQNYWGRKYYTVDERDNFYILIPISLVEPAWLW